MKTFKLMAKNYPLDSSSEVFNDPEFTKIVEVVNSLYDSGVCSNFSHNCIAACDILQAALYTSGIESKIVEVQLNIFRSDKDGNNDYLYIGYDSVQFPNQIDTHVVIITQTSTPYLIDLSLGHILPNDKNRIIHKCISNEKCICSLDINNLKLNYFIKPFIKLPQLHQKNIIDRIAEDKKTKQSLENLKFFAYYAMCISIINFFLNGVLIILKMIYP